MAIMAELFAPDLSFEGDCPDCGRRKVDLPRPLPELGDDFDWHVRDYDGFRLFMMQELAARFPERTRWTPADVEVALVEVFAMIFDQLSDLLDRVASESFLETARQPASVRRLLRLIDYDAVSASMDQVDFPDSATPSGEDEEAKRLRLKVFIPSLIEHAANYYEQLDPPSPTEIAISVFLGDAANASFDDLNLIQSFLNDSPEFMKRTQTDTLEKHWLNHPWDMDFHRNRGPATLHQQQRMVTLDDYINRIEDHPLVYRANARSDWGGSWRCISVAVIVLDNKSLDATGLDAAEVQDAVNDFHDRYHLPKPQWSASTTIRQILRQYIDAWRMTGQEVILEDAEAVGINMSIAINIRPQYFQSEILHAVQEVLGNGSGGFFEPGRLHFGEDIHASDLFEILMGLAGVEAVCLNRFKRIGNQYLDQSDSGVIELGAWEVAVCDNDLANPDNGYYKLVLNGGRSG